MIKQLVAMTRDGHLEVITPLYPKIECDEQHTPQFAAEFPPIGYYTPDDLSWGIQGFVCPVDFVKSYYEILGEL